MANITISRRFPHTPPTDAIKYGLPVTSGVTTPLVDGLNSLFGWRCLRAASWTLDYSAPLAGTYLNVAPQGISGTARLWFTTSDVNEFDAPASVFVGLVYQATPVASQQPSIQFDLYEHAGGTFRDGILFDGDPDVSTLPGGRRGSVGDRIYPLFFASTGFRTGSSATGAGTPTTPRLLNLDAADTRALMELRVTYTNARPLFVYAVEAYREVLSQ